MSPRRRRGSPEPGGPSGPPERSGARRIRLGRLRRGRPPSVARGSAGPAQVRPGWLAVRARRVAARWDAARDSWETGQLRRQLAALGRRTGLTRTGAAALVAAVVIWIVARVVAGRAMYIVAYGLLLGVGMSIALAPRRVRLTADRQGLYPRVPAGEELEVHLVLAAPRRVSTLVLEEQIPPSVGPSVRVPVARLASGATMEHVYRLRLPRRGVYQVGPLVAISSDPLGLATRTTVVAPAFELLVHPRIEAMADRPLTRQFEDPPIRPPVSRPWPSGLEFFGLRQYTPGDDLRRINWRASARTGELMVREAEQGITDKIVLVLDTDRRGHSRDGEGVSETFEAGVSAAASLGVFHLKTGFQVQLLANAGPLLRPLRGMSSQLELLDAFARVQLDREPLVGLLSRLAANPPRDAHTVIVTPRLGAAEAARLRMIVRTGASVLLVALLWDSESAGILALASELGCQVSAVHPGGDVAAAVAAEIGAGMQG